MDAQTGIGIATLTAAFGLYIIRAELRGDVTRLDGRINTHEAGCEQRQKRIDDRLTSIDHTTDRIDKKLDQLVGPGV